MKIPSLQSLTSKAFQTVVRFPIALFCASMVATLVIYMIYHSIEPMRDKPYLFNLTITCYLGMIGFIALPAYLERSEFSKPLKIAMQVFGVLLLLAFYFTLPEHFMNRNTIRVVLITIALHLLIAFIPYFLRKEENGFWQYNKSLFLRILLTWLYSAVLFGGLALAIAAIDQLFVVHFNGKIYGYLWVSIAVVFSCWFFLAGFPKDFEKLEADREYPRGLKLFTQFVLLPLITIYLVILYAYMGKIVMNWQWPDGWVSHLVLLFSIAGILSLLLIHPVRFDASNKWIPIYSRIFYFAIFPLIILLFLAIKRRIADYGITESRYFVMLLALWLLFIAGYFSISKSKNIKLIPISLFLVSALSSFGPWGAFQISENSQKHHLEKLLTNTNRIKNGQVIKSNEKIDKKVEAEITSVVEYLIENHHYSSLQEYLSTDLTTLFKNDSIDGSSTYTKTKKVLELMGLNYRGRWDYEDNSNFHYSMEDRSSYDIDGYTVFIPQLEFYETNVVKKITSANYSFSISSDLEAQKLQIENQGEKLEMDVSTIVKKLKNNSSSEGYQIPSRDLTMELSGVKFDAKVLLTQINGHEEDNKLILNSFHAIIFIKMH